MERAKYIAKIEERAKLTVGYHEASDRGAFLSGVRLAAGMAFEDVAELSVLADTQFRKHNEARAELRALARIIKKHTEDE